jgi:hypothetical protein
MCHYQEQTILYVYKQLMLTIHTDSTGLADRILCCSSSYFADNEGLEEPQAEHLSKSRVERTASSWQAAQF